MHNSEYTDEPIIASSKEADAGVGTKELSRKSGVTELMICVGEFFEQAHRRSASDTIPPCERLHSEDRQH
jgi:hypothetical protein